MPLRSAEAFGRHERVDTVLLDRAHKVIDKPTIVIIGVIANLDANLRNGTKNIVRVDQTVERHIDICRGLGHAHNHIVNVVDVDRLKIVGRFSKGDSKQADDLEMKIIRCQLPVTIGIAHFKFGTEQVDESQADRQRDINITD